MKRHVIHSIRNEPKRRVPDDVLLEPRARPHTLLDNRVPHDPTHRDLDFHTRGAIHPDTSKEEKTTAANAGARVTNTYTTGLSRITRTTSPRSFQFIFLWRLPPTPALPSTKHQSSSSRRRFQSLEIKSRPLGPHLFVSRRTVSEKSYTSFPRPLYAMNRLQVPVCEYFPGTK